MELYWNMKFSKVRRVWVECDSEWYYSVVDVVGIVIDQVEFKKARKYWNKLKQRLQIKTIGEGMTKIDQNQLVTVACHQFKMSGKDNKLRLTDAMNIENLNCLVNHIPSPHAKSFVSYLLQKWIELKKPSEIIYF